MNQELAMVLSLKKVMGDVAGGMGTARSLVSELREVGAAGREAARMVLLGHPFAVSLDPLMRTGSEEVSMLAAMIGSARSSSSTLVGANGGAFAEVLERWVKLRENARLEMKVQRFRALVTSAVLGAVTSMLATLGPLVGNLGSLQGQSVPGGGGGVLQLAAAAMVAVSSGMLGFFMAGKRFYVNVGVALVVFLAVGTLVAPLADFQISPWAVK